MMTNSPCALERMLMSVSLSTNREPEMLKKSNATPYTSMERINIHTPLPGLPKPNKANRNTHASMAISITLLIPNLLRKKGMSRMHRVRSEEHTSGLQSRQYLVCRLLLEKKQLTNTTTQLNV